MKEPKEHKVGERFKYCELTYEVNDNDNVNVNDNVNNNDNVNVNDNLNN